MRRAMMLCAAVLCLTMTLAPTALAAGADEVEVCYPTAITQSEDGTELRKLYDLGPEDDPTGIPRSDFEQDGFHYTLTDLLRQELPEHDERQHTETVSLQSANKDMASILALLPQEKEFITEDGYMGTLSLQLDTVQVEVSGYGSSTREISATRSYPNLANQDTANIPKTIQDNGRTLTLQTINWQTDNTATLDGYALGDRFTAVATYTGSATSSYVKGYTVTADYTGTVGKINLDRVRYVAIFEGTPLQPVEEVPAAAAFSWAVLLVPIGMVALVGAVAGAALFIRHRREHEPVPSLQGNPEFHVEPNLGTYYLSMNLEDPAFADVNVRKALSLAIDRDYVANTLMQGTYSPAYNLVGEGWVDTDGSSFNANANGGQSYISDDFDANLEEAKQLLADAGYPNGEGLPTITYTTNDAGYHKTVAEYLQQAWGELGINVEVNIVEWSSFTPMRRNGEYMVARNGWVGDYSDPSNMLDLFCTGNGNNDGKFSNADFDAAMEKAASTMDTAERSAALHQAEDVLMEQVGCIPVAYYNDFWLQSEKITGIWHSAYGYWYFMYGDIAE